MSKPVSIIMVEDDEGHARLIERNIRRSGVNNEIKPFTNGTDAVSYLFGADGSGLVHKDEALLILLDLNLPDMSGIDPKDHQRIFDLFRRAGTQDRPGQGIGLAHVRALVRRLGGTMSVSSELGKGSTFTVTLPATWTGINRDKQA